MEKAGNDMVSGVGELAGSDMASEGKGDRTGQDRQPGNQSGKMVLPGLHGRGQQPRWGGPPGHRGDGPGGLHEGRQHPG